MTAESLQFAERSMYTEYFGLRENPFSIAPDPAFFYISEKHREALGHLMYAFNSEGGFVLLTGEVGTGKTTVLRRLLEKTPDDCDIAFILYPRLTGEELLAAICDEFGIGHPGDGASSRLLVARIYDYLVKTHEQGRRAVLIVEEAQNLSDDVLEQIRLLTNLETNKRKLLQVVMLGQPELRDRLARPGMKQLTQRITARYHLTPLGFEDMQGYVNHRLAIAGLPRNGLFPSSVLKKLFRLTNGVPRLINVICDRALTGAYIEGKERVDRAILTTAAREVSGLEVLPGPGKRTVVAVAAACVIFLGFSAGAIYYMRERGGEKVPAFTPQTPATAGITGATVISKSVPSEQPKPVALAPLDTEADLFNEEQAIRVLLREQKIDLKVTKTANVCQSLGAFGFSCLEGRETLDGVRKMNTPVVLKLKEDDDRDRYVVVRSLGPETAALLTDGAKKIVDTKELTRRWSGDYLLFWRLPPGYRENIKPGDKGPLVVWVARQLSLAEGRGGSGAADGTYDADLAARLRRFQVDRGLVPDGLIGPKTLIRLVDVKAPDDPGRAEQRGGK